MKKRKAAVRLQALLLAIVLCLSLSTLAFAAGVSAMVVDDIWTVNFYDKDSCSYATVTRLQNAYTSSLEGLTVGETTYGLSSAEQGSVLTDDFGKTWQATFKLSEAYFSGTEVDIVESSELLTIVINNGEEVSYSREELAECITVGEYSYSGNKTDAEETPYFGIATEYITIPELLEFLGIDECSSISFRPIDWEGKEVYIRTMSGEDAAEAVLALKSYQSENQSDVSAGKADTMNAFRLIPSESIKTGFDSVKWVNYISITGTLADDGGGTPSTPSAPSDPSVPDAEDKPGEDADTEPIGYVDVDEDDWFYEAVSYVTGKGLMNGMGNNDFQPKTTTSRAMIVTILYRLEGEPDVNGGSTFTDVEDGKWYTDAVIWAAGNKIVEGYGDGTFKPTVDVTREQMAAILYRYASYKGCNVTASTELSGYTDADSISAWAVEEMMWANAEGLITGRSANIIAPKDTATRAEVATMFMRLGEKNQ